MRRHTSIIAMMGVVGLSLVSAACSSSPSTRTTAQPPSQGDVIAAYGTPYDPQAGTGTACISRTDEKGIAIYDDPNCPVQYRQSQLQVGNSYENVRTTQESAFFDRYASRAVKHAREAEAAGNQGRAADLRHHAQLSLDQATEAQRAGNVPGLSEGIAELREALSLPDSAVLNATAQVRDARIHLSQAAKIRPVDERAVARTERDR